MFRANTVYEGEYLLGISIARPLIAQRLVEIATETGADASPTARRVKGTIRCDLSWALCAQTWDSGDCALARMGPQLERVTDGLL